MATPNTRTILTTPTLRTLYDVAAAKPDSQEPSTLFWKTFINGEFPSKEGWVKLVRKNGDTPSDGTAIRYKYITRNECFAAIVWIDLDQEAGEVNVERMLCRSDVVCWSDKYDISEVYIIFTRKLEFGAAKVNPDHLKAKKHPLYHGYVGFQPLYYSTGGLEWFKPHIPIYEGIQEAIEYMKDKLNDATYKQTLPAPGIELKTGKGESWKKKLGSLFR